MTSILAYKGQLHNCPLVILFQCHYRYKTAIKARALQEKDSAA